MKLSLDWIQDYVGELPDSPKAIGLKMTLATAEIEGHETLGNDTVYDIDNKSLTHRPDLWGHYGFAREVAAVYKTPLKPLDLGQWSWPTEAADPLSVRIETESALCPRYNGVVISNIAVGPSPDWLVERLEKLGARAINNIVDLTNYVMLETAQPMHAFDRHKIAGDQIVVRLAQTGEIIQTLDGGEHTLGPEMMVIADRDKAVAIAGVMGGANSEVDDKTTSIVLESANFHPAHVRRTAAALGIRTDSSMRFEKGQDPLQTETAVRRFITLLLQICPQARLETPLLNQGLNSRESIVISTSYAFINQRLGTQLKAAEIRSILERLQFGIQEGEAGDIQVSVPSFRANGDIGMAMDLVEEVGRVFGYDNITPQDPLIPVAPVRPSRLQALQRQLRTVLSRDLAFAEVFNYAFVGEKLLQQVGLSPAGHQELANPLASDQNLLRTSLVPNMLKITAENLRFRKQFQIFELERVFSSEPQDSDYEFEGFALCGLCCNSAWKGSESAFYAAKAAAEALLAQLPFAGKLRFAPPQHLPAPWCHPGRTAELRVDGQLIGYVSQLHPQIAENMDIKSTVSLFELDVSALLKLPEASARYVKVQKYPTVPFDISLICEERTLIADVQDRIWAVDPKVRQLELFDVYRGENIGPGKKSLAFTVTFAAPDHTLQPAEIDSLQQGVINSLEQAGYLVRKG